MQLGWVLKKQFFNEKAVQNTQRIQAEDTRNYTLLAVTLSSLLCLKMLSTICPNLTLISCFCVPLALF